MSLTTEKPEPQASRLTDAVGFVVEDVISQVLHVPPRKLQRWRELGEGPPFYKFNMSVRYRLPEVLEWAATQRRLSTTGHRRKPPAPAAAEPVVAAPAPIATLPAEQPRKKRGWPKGKPRGPRKAPTMHAGAAE